MQTVPRISDTTRPQKTVSSRIVSPDAYHPDWVVAKQRRRHPLWVTGGSRPLTCAWPGVLTSAAGASSIFLRREFGVPVWAADLWFSPSENMQRIRDAGVEDGVFPLHADARALPFAPDFFDAIVSVDSFYSYGTDDLYLNYLARFVKAGGPVGIAGAGLMREIEGPLPDHLREWWTQDLWCLHSAAWWRRHWERTGILSIDVADTMPDGWLRWLEWHRVIAPDNALEIAALEADRGEYLGYVRVVGRRQAATFDEHVVSLPRQYTKAPLLRP
jgi:hypothetical protein